MKQRKECISRQSHKKYLKINLLEKCLEASKTHQVSTVGLHRNTQQQVTDGADEFPVDFFSIFIRDLCSGHDWENASTTKQK